MSTMTEKPILQITEKEFHQMCESCGMDPNEVQKSRETVLNWLSKQPHLKDVVPYLAKTYGVERALQLCKGSTELCQQMQEKIITSRSLVPDIIMNRSIDEFEVLLRHVNHVALPKLVPQEFSCVTIVQFKTSNLDHFSMLSYLRYMFMVGEFRAYSYCGITERFIMDFQNVPFALVAKFNPILVRKAEVITTECFGAKIKGIHILNAPSFVDKIIAIMKHAMKPKVAARIHVHNTFEELYKHIPKEMLPKDYGGDEDSCADLTEQWTAQLQKPENRQKIQDLDKIVPDESKRSNSKFNEEYMGMPGSFKKLEVD